MSMPPPNIAIHLRKSGALFRRHPVTPPKSNRGDTTVPMPNKSAIIKPSIGAANGKEYKRSASKGGQTAKPLEKPKEKARKSIF